MAWQGRACAASQRLPGGVFTAAPLGAPHLALPPTCTHTQRFSRRSTTGVEEEAGEVSRSVANLMLNPERDPAMDLLGEEAADGTVRWRRKRALG
jgi:hypothetical protein